MYLHPEGPLEVTALDFRYTPNGLMYELDEPAPVWWTG